MQSSTNVMQSRIRPAKPEDMSFVFDSWLKSWRTSKYSGVVPNNLYFDTYRSTIENVIGRGSSIVVATAQNNEDHILGWACFETTPDGRAVVHYLYVKDPYLKFGIPDKLLEYLEGDKPGFYTFNYPQVTDALKYRWPGVKWGWAPEIARRK